MRSALAGSFPDDTVGGHEAAVGADVGIEVALGSRSQVDPLAAVGHVEHSQVAASTCTGPSWTGP